MEEVRLFHARSIHFIERHRFIILIFATVFISLILVTISLYIYNVSGASQLDLSRPGYRSVSAQTVHNDQGFSDYPVIGPMTPQAISDFKNLYDTQAQTTTEIDPYGGDPLNPSTLEFGQSSQAATPAPSPAPQS